MTSRDKAYLRELSGKIMNEGVRALDRHEYGMAIAKFQAASEIDSTYFAPYLNHGLAQKALREWELASQVFVDAWSCLPANVSAAAYASVLWNIGICASVTGRWARARWAWDRLGFNVTTKLDTPPSIPLGLAWINGSEFSFALGQRLDPVRIRVQRTNHRDASLKIDTIVVHDADRTGSKIHQGQELPVFAVLAEISS